MSTGFNQLLKYEHWLQLVVHNVSHIAFMCSYVILSMLQRSIHPGATKTWSLRWGLELLETAPPGSPTTWLFKRRMGPVDTQLIGRHFGTIPSWILGPAPIFCSKPWVFLGFMGEKQDSSKNLVAIRLYVAWTKQQNIELASVYHKFFSTLLLYLCNGLLKMNMNIPQHGCTTPQFRANFAAREYHRVTGSVFIKSPKFWHSTSGKYIIYIHIAHCLK